MKAENKAFLDRFKPFHDKLQLGGTIHMTMDDRVKMQDIIRQEWDPKYVTCLTCNEGVIDLLKMAYNNYDQVQAAAPVEQPKATVNESKKDNTPKTAKTAKAGKANAA
jgi:hypothetical protein